MNLFKRSSIVFVSVMIALLIAEYCVRTFDPQLTIDAIKTPYSFDCFAKGSYYWIGMKPKANCILHSFDGAFPDVHVQTTDLGLRSDRISREKKPDTLRILILGDSFSFGWGVSFEQSYPQRIKELLAKQFPNKTVEILNASVPASGPDYYYLFLKNEGLSYAPDIILVGFNMFNDVTYNMNYSVWSKLDEKGLPLSSDSALDIVNDDRILPKTLPVSLRTSLLNHSHLFVKVASTVSKGVTTTELSPSWYVCYYKPGCHTLDESIHKTKRILTAIQQLGKTIGATTIVVMIPEEIQLNDAIEKKYGVPIRLLRSDLERPVHFWNEFLSSERIVHIDLLNALQSAKDPLYFEKEIHWNEAGHARAADVIFNTIVSMYQHPAN